MDRKRFNLNADGGDGEDFLRVNSFEFEQTGKIDDPVFCNRPTSLTINALLDPEGKCHLEILMPSATFLQQLKLYAMIIHRLCTQWKERVEDAGIATNPVTDAVRDSTELIEKISADLLKLTGSVTGNTPNNGDIHNK